jgi:acetyl esterase/lipase
VITYYHGGGWVIADLATYESSAMALAQKAKAIVVSVEYRHAPEHKFPAAHEDSFAAERDVYRADRLRAAIADDDGNVGWLRFIKCTIPQHLGGGSSCF